MIRWTFSKLFFFLAMYLAQDGLIFDALANKFSRVKFIEVRKI